MSPSSQYPLLVIHSPPILTRLSPLASLTRRDTESYKKYLDTSHDLSSTGYNLDTPLSTIFADNATAAFTPETILGPYWVQGEQLRRDITDGERGVATHMDVQFIDIKTCLPVPNLLIDIWHANATGIYSGLVYEGQGGLNSTFLRGVQQTDKEGVAQFDTIFPGHYDDRTHHIHVTTTQGAEALDNGTFTGGTAKHIGQLYFDEALTNAVEATDPYNTSKLPFTTNLADAFAAQQASPEYDPFMKYTFLGDKTEDGILMWITIAIDPDANYNVNMTPAAKLEETGGRDLTNGTVLPF
ncbi:hypothetical protein CDD81_7723 [Ophiocordyceps australis]|uniref:Intradiol ring-cleavage dioxygenases domain-containing protein n=1 Tax=Ophiocordyceps australis TaxID=1399860 RepID=A0A2C5XGM5_9HYPO|nr:hypothetical protein CDD81_7723 [Ophiocordyceps australis]